MKIVQSQKRSRRPGIMQRRYINQQKQMLKKVRSLFFMTFFMTFFPPKMFEGRAVWIITAKPYQARK
jgi:hypothetical protein